MTTSMSSYANPQSGIGAVDPILDFNTGPYDQRPQVQFTTVSVPLTSRVSSKIKAKIWANEYINFGTLLSDSPQQEGKYSEFGQKRLLVNGVVSLF